MDEEQNYATVSGTKVHRSDFAYAPAGSGPSEWKLPIHDANHVRNALARWNQSDLPADAKEGVWRKIVAAAKKYGIRGTDESSEITPHPPAKGGHPLPRGEGRGEGVGRIAVLLAGLGKQIEGDERFGVTAIGRDHDCAVLGVHHRHLITSASSQLMTTSPAGAGAR